MTAFDYLKSLPRHWLPRKPSNSELFRWLRNKSVIINGVHVSPKEEVGFPIKSLTFFPNKRKVTMV